MHFLVDISQSRASTCAPLSHSPADVARTLLTGCKTDCGPGPAMRPRGRARHPGQQASWVSTNSIGVTRDTDLPLQALRLFEEWGGGVQNSGPLKRPSPVNSASRGCRPRVVLDGGRAPSCRQKNGGPRPEGPPPSPSYRCDTEERAGPRSGASTALAPEFFVAPRGRVNPTDKLVGADCGRETTAGDL